MARFIWNDALSTQIPSIDGQHQKLVALINDLDAAMAQGRGKAVVGKILDELIEYTKSHFAYEEALFQKHGYPEAPFHVNEHINLISKVVDFQRKAQAGQIGLSIPTMEFLVAWLKNHIQGCDKNYSEFLIQKGVR